MSKSILLIFLVAIFFSCDQFKNEQDFDFEITLEGTTQKKLLGTSSTYAGATFIGTPFYSVGLNDHSDIDIFLTITFSPTLPSPGIYSFNNPADSIFHDSMFSDLENKEYVIIDSGELIIQTQNEGIFTGEISGSGLYLMNMV